VDDSRILRIDHRTYADESFRIADPQGLVVLANLPEWADLRWHADLGRACGRELKWSKIGRCWRDLSADLRRAVLRCLREALITIVDPSVYRFDLEQTVIAAVGQPRKAWPAKFETWVQEQLVEYEKHRILTDSPILRIDSFLRGDDFWLDDAGDLTRDGDNQTSLLPVLTDSLKAPHTARLFGARSAAAYWQLLDHDTRERALAELWEVRYITPARLAGHVLAIAERAQRVYDEGNQPSVLALADVSTAVRQRLAARELIVLPNDIPPGAVEQSSSVTPALQASDLAAGYARRLYLEQGLKAVCEEFRSVIFNGSMIRDWARVDRPDAAELRVRK